eukprot:ANDGO_05039.mRNA.1 hypothetical protein GUITHDRAFT_112521
MDRGSSRQGGERDDAGSIHSYRSNTSSRRSHLTGSYIGSSDPVADLNRLKNAAFTLLSEAKRRLPEFASFHETELSTKLLSALRLYIVQLIRTLRFGKAAQAKKAAELLEVETDNVAAKEKYEKELSDVVGSYRDAEEGMDGSLRAVALYYSLVLSKYSDYQRPRQEAAFFETLYEYVVNFCKKAADAKTWKIVEVEVNRIFRSSHFNVAQRVHLGPRAALNASTASSSSDGKKKSKHLSSIIPSKDLYRLKHELHWKPKPGSALHTITSNKDMHVNLQDACSSTTPLVSALLPEHEEARQMKKRLWERSPAVHRDAPASPSSTIFGSLSVSPKSSRRVDTTFGSLDSTRPRGSLATETQRSVKSLHSVSSSTTSFPRSLATPAISFHSPQTDASTLARVARSTEIMQRAELQLLEPLIPEQGQTHQSGVDNDSAPLSARSQPSSARSTSSQQGQN